ncbi:MAG: Proline iminopeptidase [Paracidovorax wautersii]|uniref:Proline iminopeptidase n=1 Tax=Paracidovorax wautersii TaxID=1177982 RepID=A0A7V8JRC8_9BURK|nr:MAG: Proline iminopeptidase [Paracidovorax wautersii]
MILIDQRGAGRSIHDDGPRAAAVSNNTTQDLLSDLERLRTALGIERWVVAGGSWGATLALAYAARWPQCVQGLMLRAPFLASAAEVHALLSAPAAPAAAPPWRDLLAWAADLEPATPRQRLARLYALLFAGDDALALNAAQAWTRNEQARAALPSGIGAAGGNAPAVLQRARVQVHYLVHGCFVDMPAVLASLRGWGRAHPWALVQGGADALCPPAQAHRVAECLGGDAAALRIVPGVGHDAFAPAMLAAWHAGLDALARGLQRVGEGAGS